MVCHTNANSQWKIITGSNVSELSNQLTSIYKVQSLIMLMIRSLWGNCWANFGYQPVRKDCIQSLITIKNNNRTIE